MKLLCLRLREAYYKEESILYANMSQIEHTVFEKLMFNENFGKNNEQILIISLINFINILAKTIKYKETLNINFSKIKCLISVKFEN